jgi:hypothetical protein
MNPPLVGSEDRNKNGVFPAIDQDGIEYEEYDHKVAHRLIEVPESLKAGSGEMKDDPLF